METPDFLSTFSFFTIDSDWALQATLKPNFVLSHELVEPCKIGNQVVYICPLF